MEQEVMVFIAFASLTIVFNALEGKAHLHKQFEGMLYWLLHPNTIHTLRDYSVHLMVYSGYVLGSH